MTTPMYTILTEQNCQHDEKNEASIPSFTALQLYLFRNSGAPAVADLSINTNLLLSGKLGRQAL